MKLTDKGGQRVLAPEGSHVARCFMVIDLGTQTTDWKGKPRQSRKILIGLELPTELHTFDEAVGDQPFTVLNRFTASLNEKAVLRQVLTQWRGRAFTPDELKGFEVKQLVGAAGLVSVVHKDGYANIAGIAKLPKGMKCPPAVNDPVYFSLEPDEFSRKTYEQLSDKIKEVIADSPEFGKLVAGDPADGGGAPDADDTDPFSEDDDSSSIPF